MSITFKLLIEFILLVTYFDSLKMIQNCNFYSCSILVIRIEICQELLT